MMISHGRRCSRIVRLAILGLGLASAGCASITSRVTVVSYKDPYFPEPTAISLYDCAYWNDGSGDLHVAARGSGPYTASATGPIERILYVHVYWRPHPGVTFANETTTTATIRYVVATRNGAAMYTGTGFAYPKKPSGGQLEIDIESANLQLDSITGEGPEVLGVSRLTGTMIARCDPHLAVDLMRESELLATGARVP